MELFSNIQTTRAKNARALAAFDLKPTDKSSGTLKTVRVGTSVTIFTIGYEKRDGEGLMAALRDQGIRILADVRERPMSRKPDFRAAALKAFCENAGIEYQPWPMLGSTGEQREELVASGNFQAFERAFRKHALKTMKEALAKLAASVQQKPTALLCYERLHEDCHRSTIADLLAEQLDAMVIAIQ